MIKNFKLKIKNSHHTQCDTYASSQRKELYTPKGVFIHVTSLRQAFAHCGRFSTAASRRSMARVAVPFLGVALSRPLPVIDLVSHYLTNYLIGRRSIQKRFASLLLLRSAFHLSFGRTSLALQSKITLRLYPSGAFCETKSERGDYGELPRLSTSYAPLLGWYPRVTKPFAAGNASHWKTNFHKSQISFLTNFRESQICVNS